MSHSDPSVVFVPTPQPCVHFDSPLPPVIELRPETLTPPYIPEPPAAPVIIAPCPGVSGDGAPYVPPIDFAYGDASSVRWVAPIAGRVVEVRVDIDAAFNGAGASISVGTQSDPDAIMAATKNNPYEVAMYNATTEIALAQGDGIWLAISPGSGASQGAGTLHVTFVPEN